MSWQVIVEYNVYAINRTYSATSQVFGNFATTRSYVRAKVLAFSSPQVPVTFPIKSYKSIYISLNDQLPTHPIY